MPILGITASSKLGVTGAFESIATATGTGSSGTITFSSIPSTYQHLQIRINARCLNTGTAANQVRIQFNSDTGSNYARHSLYGDGSTVTAAGNASQTSILCPLAITQNGTTANIHSGLIMDIHDYISSTKNKTLRIFNGQDLNGSGHVNLNSGLWMSTNTINSITIFLPSDNFTTSSTFALYGIRGA